MATNKLITARQARLRFVNEDYVQAMQDVANAILETSTGGHKVCVDIPTGKRIDDLSVSYHVAQSLRENGFDVIMIHDSENNSTELTVSWSGLLTH